MSVGERKLEKGVQEAMNTMDLEAEREILELGSLGEHSFSWWGFQKGQNQDQYWILHSAIQLLDNDAPEGGPSQWLVRCSKTLTKGTKTHGFWALKTHQS